MADITVTTSSKPLSPAAAFLRVAEGMAIRTLAQMLGDEQGRQKAAQFGAAFSAAAASQRDGGKAMYACSPESVAQAMVTTILSGITPGGPMPGCYLLPKGGHLQWWLNHRGMIRLADLVGFQIQVRPVFPGDICESWDDEAGPHFRFQSAHPPEAETFDALEAVLVIVRRGGVLVDVLRVSKLQIEDRRKASDNQGGPWTRWPLEMAYKSAIKYVFARGVVPVGGDIGAQMALRVEDEQEAEARAEVEAAAPKAPPRQIAHDPLSVLDRMPESAPERVEVPVPPVLEFHADLAEKAQEVLRMEGELDPARVLALRQEAGISGPVASDAVLERYRAALLKALQ